MRAEFRSLLVVLALGMAGPAMAAPKGTLRVCRPEYADAHLNGIRLDVPAGVVFDDWGRVEDKVPAPSSVWNLHIVTTAPFTIPPGKKCASVPAAITKSSAVRRVSPSDHRDFEIGTMLDRMGGELEPLPSIWDWLVQTTATVEKPFA